RLPGRSAGESAARHPHLRRGTDGPDRARARREQGLPAEERRRRRQNAEAAADHRRGGAGPMTDTFVRTHLDETAKIAAAIDAAAVERMVATLVSIRARGGRLFFLGVGGGAAHASHAVNDFRKLAGFEAYAPTDNVSELTARTNDDGWDTVFRAWLEASRLQA